MRVLAIFFIGLQLGCESNMSVVSGIDDFGEVGSSLLINSKPLDLYMVLDGDLTSTGAAEMDPIYISTRSVDCDEWQAEMETMGRLSQKVIDAAGANLDISNACSEMNELQAFYEQTYRMDYPRNSLSFAVSEFLEQDPYAGTFDVVGYHTHSKVKCGSYWSADSCSFIVDSCNEEERTSYRLEGSATFDVIGEYATGTITAERTNEEEQSLGQVDIELDLYVCEQPSVNAYILY